MKDARWFRRCGKCGEVAREGEELCEACGYFEFFLFKFAHESPAVRWTAERLCAIAPSGEGELSQAKARCETVVHVTPFDEDWWEGVEVDSAWDPGEAMVREERQAWVQGEKGRGLIATVVSLVLSCLAAAAGGLAIASCAEDGGRLEGGVVFAEQDPAAPAATIPGEIFRPRRRGEVMPSPSLEPAYKALLAVPVNQQKVTWTPPPVCPLACTGKQCGNDGCGGVCGVCGDGKACDGNGNCVSECLATLLCLETVQDPAGWDDCLAGLVAEDQRSAFLALHTCLGDELGETSSCFVDWEECAGRVLEQDACGTEILWCSLGIPAPGAALPDEGVGACNDELPEVPQVAVCLQWGQSEDGESCKTRVQPFFCAVEDSCLPAGTVHPQDPCRACLPWFDAEDYSFRGPGEVCGLGAVCDDSEKCVSLGIGFEGLTMVPAGQLDGGPYTEPACPSVPGELAPSLTLSHPLAVGRTEVSAELWNLVMPELQVTTPGEYPAAARPADAFSFLNRLSKAYGLPPCYEVEEDGLFSWDHDSFCGFRLPSESEWEYLARAGSATPLYGGGLTSCEGADENLDPLAWYAGNSGGALHKVGLKEPNGFGLYDVLGNAAELVWGTYAGGYQIPGTVSTHSSAEEDYLLARGGHAGLPPGWCTASARIPVSPLAAHPLLSLRWVLQLD